MLFERWTAEPGDGFEKIPVHTFGAALSELARGSVTKAQLVAAFSLDAADETELDAITAKYAAEPTALAKAAFIAKLEDVMVLSSAGFYSKAKAKTELGF